MKILSLISPRSWRVIKRALRNSFMGCFQRASILLPRPSKRGLSQAPTVNARSMLPLKLQGWDHPAYFIDPSGVDLSHNEARLFSAIGQDPSPRVDYERVAISSPTIRAHPTLARRKDITAGLDGAGAHQDMPVCFPGSPGKGRGDREISGTSLGQGTVEIGKAHVITDA